MLDLNDLYYFASVVKHGGFSTAGRALNIPKSSLSRRVVRLETQVGVRLIERSTRGVQLTDLGQEFYMHCVGMIDEAEAAEEIAARRHGIPRGIVRVSCPPGLAQTVVADRLPRFLQQYPDVRVQLRVSNRRVDLVEERLDIALRVRSRLDTDASLIMRTLAKSRFMLVASPSLLAEYGNPVSIEDLRRMPTLSMDEQSNEDTWHLIGPDGNDICLLHEPRLASSDFNILLESAIKGIGVALLPDSVCEGAIRDGRVMHILPERYTQVGIVDLVFVSRRGLLPAVRVFIDFLVHAFAEQENLFFEGKASPERDPVPAFSDVPRTMP